MKRLVWIIALALSVSACGNKSSSPSSPTSPSSTSTKVIGLSGNLAFGNVPIGTTAVSSVTITNSGNAALTVTSITGPSGYASNWSSGSIAPGGSQNVDVRFSPTAIQTYSGTMTVLCDLTSGTNTMAVSGTGVALIGSLSGTVTSSTTGGVISGATIKVLDGPDAGKTTITNASGAYTFSPLTIGNANFEASATGFGTATKGTYVNGVNTLNFALLPPPFTKKGSGDTVFDMPTSVRRVFITADYPHNSSNFVVYIGGSLIVNELVGYGWGMPHFEGTYLTTGGVVQIKLSSGVNWTFTEVR